MAGLLANIGSKLWSGTKMVGGAAKDVAKDELYGSLGNFGSALRKRVESRPPEEKKDELSDIKKDINQQNENIASTEKAVNDAKKDAQKYQTNYVFKSIDYKLDNIQLSQKYILHDVNRLMYMVNENKQNNAIETISQPQQTEGVQNVEKSSLFDKLSLGKGLLGRSGGLLGRMATGVGSIGARVAPIAAPIIAGTAIGSIAGYIFGDAINKILSPIRKGLGYTAENYPGMAKWGREHSFWNGQTQQTTQSEKVLTEQEKQKQRNNVLINAGDYKIDSSRNVSIVSLGSMLFESKSSDTIRFKSPHIVFEGNRIDFIENKTANTDSTSGGSTSAGPQGATFDPNISAPAFGGTPETKGAYTGFTAPMDATSIAADNQNARKFTGSAETGSSGGGKVESNEFYKAIIDAEGTAKHGNPYDTSLGYMKSPKPLSQMTMDEALAWGEQVKKAQGLNSSAKGAFQIVNTTQKAAMAALGLKGSDLFNEVNQKKMASWIAHKQGLGAWEGFKKHPEQLKIAQQALQGGKDKDFNSTTTSQSSSNIKVEKTKPVENTSDAVKNNLSPVSSAPSLTPASFGTGTGTGITPVSIKTETITPTNKNENISSTNKNENATSTGGSTLEVAQKFLGKSEANAQEELQQFIGRYHHPINIKKTPWCAAFVNGVLGSSGMKGTGSDAARSFLGYGGTVWDRASNQGDLKQVQPGDIAVFNRNGQGHVGFVKSISGDSITIIGGNQSDRNSGGQVSVSSRNINSPGSELLSIRRAGGGNVPTSKQQPGQQPQGSPSSATPGLGPNTGGAGQRQQAPAEPSLSPQPNIGPKMYNASSGGASSNMGMASMAGNMLGGMIPGGMGKMMAPMIGSALASMSADMKVGNLGNMMGVPGAQLNNMSQNDIMNQRASIQPHVENHKLAQLSQPAKRTNIAPNYSQKSTGFIATPTDEEHYFGSTGFMRPVTEHSKAYASASGHRSAGAFLT